MRAALLVLVAILLVGSGSRAQDGSRLLDRTDAFDTAYAASFYDFDACGDPLTGRSWRRALVEKFSRCPFSPEAKARFQRRSAAQRVKAGHMIQSLIDEHGGLPVRLQGMDRTCREQIESAEYAAVRTKLEDYLAGQVTADAVIGGTCDGTAITP